jgi:sugar lactone lactonase YvrE
MRATMMVLCVLGCGGSPTASVEVVAAGQLKPWGVVLDADRVYWTNLISNGDVMVVDKTGGTAQPIASMQPLPARLTLDATSVYFTTAEGGTVRRAPKLGGSAIDIATGGVRPARIVVDATYVYWTDEMAPGVYRAELTGGGTILPLASGGIETPTGIAVDASFVYFGDLGTKQVSRVRKDGTGLEVIATDELLLQDLALDEHALYWVSAAGMVRRRELTTGTVTTITEGLRGPRALALDDKHVYVTTSVGNEVIRVDKLGGEAQVLANDECGPFGIAVDATTVYWAATDCGEVRSIAK